MLVIAIWRFNKLPVTYSDFLEIAKYNFNKESVSEIELRSVIHQSYYSVYHKGYDVANKLRISPLEDEIGSSHAKLKDFYFDLLGVNPRILLTEESKKSSIKISYILKTLHDKRVVADYKTDEYVDAQNTALFLKQIESCLQLMKNVEGLIT